jgi:alpha-ketoglutaric semialdehyde dehydrogenase
MYTDTPIEEIPQLAERSWKAFEQYRKVSLATRAKLLRTIAEELELAGDDLIKTAMSETNLPEPRLRNERNRTIFQLNSYGEATEKGNWLEARIDTADANRTPPKPDIRKMLVPVGPVVVFGASNFPFAYSTAGGDTACALAAGCSVIVKAHPAHPGTSLGAAKAIQKALSRCGLPEDIFIHIYGAGSETGRTLVTHPKVKSVGFTGSYGGGKALFDWANQRKEPIPVFAEMGSVNPVFLFPEQLKSTAKKTAEWYAASITLSVGQFCTNPGLLVAIKGPELDEFVQELGVLMSNVAPGKMLHGGIAKSYQEKKTAALAQAGNELVAASVTAPGDGEGEAVLAQVNGQTFLANPLLHQEVFGPYSLVTVCEDASEMEEVAKHLEGQLTATLMATEADLINHSNLVDHVKNICGRVIVNGVPTGVEVCLAMHHGGPFPSTTDARFTSVGADGIKRFARPLSFQNWPDNLLPDELKNGNPLDIWRTVNNNPGKEKISA